MTGAASKTRRKCNKVILEKRNLVWAVQELCLCAEFLRRGIEVVGISRFEQRRLWQSMGRMGLSSFTSLRIRDDIIGLH